MNSVDFCFWLQGFFEISDASEITPKQVEIIKNHLNLVFLHEIDPLREAQTTASKEDLNNTHFPMIPAVLNGPIGDAPYRPKQPTPMSGNDVKMRC